MTTLSLRMAIAVPAALCLAFGGALLAAGPASAVPLIFAVTSPTSTTPAIPASEVEAVPFSGTGLTTGDAIAVTYQGGTNGTTPEVATVTAPTNDGSGNWTASVGFPATAPGQDGITYRVTELAAGVPDTNATVAAGTFTFATAPVLGTAELQATPSAATIEDASSTGFTVGGGEYGPSEPLTFALVGPKGESLVPTGTIPATTNADGTFQANLIVPADAPGGDYVLKVTGTVSGQSQVAGLAILGDPTITAPADGSKLVGKSVTFTGTATPGSEILVILDTTADFNATLGSASTPQAMMRSAKADGTIVSPKASDPTGTFLPVGASGTWSVTADDVPAGDYTFIVISQVDDGTGAAVVNESSDPLITGAGPSEFTLAAPAVTTTAATGPTLAFTGSQDAVPAAIGGGLLLLVGAGLVVVARRRRHAAE